MKSSSGGSSLTQGLAKRIGSLAALALVVFFLSANKACQKDYFFADQANVTRATPTETPDSSDPTETPTRTPIGTAPSGTVAATRTPRSTRTATPTATGGGASSARAAFSLLRELESASGGEGDEEDSELVASASPLPTVNVAIAGPGSRQAANSGNWLGNLYSGSEAPPRIFVVGEGAAYQRSMQSLLKGLGVESSAVASSSELRAVTGAPVTGTAQGRRVAVLDAQSTTFPPCQVANQIGGGSNVTGAITAYVVVNSAPAATQGGSQGSFLCDGRAIGEVVPAPINRIGLRRAIERAVSRSGSAQ